MDTRPTRTEMLDLIRAERARLEQLVAAVPKDDQTRPGVAGDWSVKDLMAHVTDWEVYLARLLRAGVRGEPPPLRDTLTEEAIERINVQVAARSRRTPLDDVLVAFWQAGGEMIAAVEALSDADLYDASRKVLFLGPDKQATVLENIAANTYEHYREHADSIEEWLARKGAGG